MYDLKVQPVVAESLESADLVLDMQICGKAENVEKSADDAKMQNVSAKITLTGSRDDSKEGAAGSVSENTIFPRQSAFSPIILQIRSVSQIQVQRQFTSNRK